VAKRTLELETINKDIGSAYLRLSRAVKQTFALHMIAPARLLQFDSENDSLKNNSKPYFDKEATPSQRGPSGDYDRLNYTCTTRRCTCLVESGVCHEQSLGRRGSRWAAKAISVDFFVFCQLKDNSIAALHTVRGMQRL
jgi:hypothetical protein